MPGWPQVAALESGDPNSSVNDSAVRPAATVPAAVPEVAAEVLGDVGWIRRLEQNIQS